MICCFVADILLFLLCCIILARSQFLYSLCYAASLPPLSRATNLLFLSLHVFAVQVIASPASLYRPDGKLHLIEVLTFVRLARQYLLASQLLCAISNQVPRIENRELRYSVW